MPGCRCAPPRLEAVGQARQSEISDQHVTAPIDHDVRRFQIAVQNASIMRRRDTGTEFARNLESFILRQAADAPHQRAEVLTVHVLHREVRLAFDITEIVDAANVGMRNLPRDADFSEN